MPFLTRLVIGSLSLLRGIRVRLLDSKDGVATEQAVGMNMGYFLMTHRHFFVFVCYCSLTVGVVQKLAHQEGKIKLLQKRNTSMT